MNLEIEGEKDGKRQADTKERNNAPRRIPGESVCIVGFGRVAGATRSIRHVASCTAIRRVGGQRHWYGVYSLLEQSQPVEFPLSRAPAAGMFARTPSRPHRGLVGKMREEERKRFSPDVSNRRGGRCGRRRC